MHFAINCLSIQLKNLFWQISQTVYNSAHCLGKHKHQKGSIEAILKALTYFHKEKIKTKMGKCYGYQ